MAEQTFETYHGNCHCGAFKFAVELPEELKEAYACNCSICSKVSFITTFTYHHSQTHISNSVLMGR